MSLAGRYKEPRNREYTCKARSLRGGAVARGPSSARMRRCVRKEQQCWVRGAAEPDGVLGTRKGSAKQVTNFWMRDNGITQRRLEQGLVFN